MKILPPLAALFLFATPATAETIEELEARLAAQKEINKLLKQRIETLEAELAGREIPPPSADFTPGPDIAVDDPELDRALERALERRGAAVLRPYAVEVTPSLAWSHAGRDAISSTQDTLGAGLEARIGFPGGWMIGAAVPFFYRDINGVGSNTGIGDASATVWKSILQQDGTWPSLVGSLRYGAPTGDDIGDDAVPLGSGFHRITGRFSSVKTVDPIAFFGDLSYTHYFADTISGVDLDRSDVFGFGLGSNLAVTPDVTISASFDFAFENEFEINGVEVRGSDTTIGQFTLGAGVVLTRDIFLSLTGGVGITDDSPDVIIGVSLPIRF
jgi:hypothetical protein